MQFSTSRSNNILYKRSTMTDGLSAHYGIKLKTFCLAIGYHHWAILAQ